MSFCLIQMQGKAQLAMCMLIEVMFLYSYTHLYVRFICAKTSANLESPQRFRTYAGLPNQASDCKIWEAGRATTATPTIFKAIVIVGLGGISSSYIDAGLGHNNPSKEVREEAMQLFGSDCPVGVFLSIGTGHPGPNGFQQPKGMEKILSVKLMETVTNIAADCESVSIDFARQYNSNPGTYFRFNVIYGTGILAVDDWQRESDILAHTNAYLRDPNTSRMIQEMVECLCSSFSLEKVHTLGTLVCFIYFYVLKNTLMQI